ncbi:MULTISPECIES: hypothetical protein [Acetobacter]|uniref:hypothetical protein n=1 Tax=Acetobacter TaxID=434 RepID=UPI001BA6F871|nr:MULTISPECIES: hypothetical protein [Acetobacter]MBS1016936.1 hypothetical protein [Acetobacter persici]MCP1270916.1 hypothetical protein [Acetobacter cerevisiae]MCP1278853.1 hypothetical protein [Acetobacter cerevisiae]
MTWETVLQALPLFGVLGGAAALVLLGRHRALAESHGKLEERVLVLEATLPEVRAQSMTLAEVKHTLDLVQRDGKNNNELLHTIIRGHLGDKS